MGSSTVDVRREARAAGIDDHEALDLATLERRRQQMWIFVGIALVVVSGAIAAVAISPGLADRLVVDPKVLHLGLPVLCLAFAAYGFDKERSLRRLTAALIRDEVSREQLRIQSSRLRAALESGKELAATLDPDEVVDTLLSGAFELSGATIGSVVLVDQFSDLEVAATRGDARGALVHHETIEMVALTRMPVRLSPDDVDRDRQPPAGARDLRVDHALLVPIGASGQTLGVLTVAAPEDPPFTDEDLSVLSCFADFAAGALINARRFQRQSQDSERRAAIESARSEFTWLSSDTP